MTLDSIVCTSPDQVSCDLEGEAAILNAKTGIYYGLDSVGASIWSLIQRPTRLGAVRDAIVREYEVDSARCESNLLELAQELAAAGLIQVCEGGLG